MNTWKNVKINYAFAFFTNKLLYFGCVQSSYQIIYILISNFISSSNSKAWENFHKFTNQKPLHKCFLMLSSLSYFEAMLNVLRVEENSRLVLKLITHHSISYVFGMLFNNASRKEAMRNLSKKLSSLQEHAKLTCISQHGILETKTFQLLAFALSLMHE